jgi:hypothetical protein
MAIAYYVKEAEYYIEEREYYEEQYDDEPPEPHRGNA